MLNAAPSQGNESKTAQTQTLRVLHMSTRGVAKKIFFGEIFK